MTKTIDIATIGNIDKNSALIFGKTTSNKIGYIDGVFNDKGELADVDQQYSETSTKPQSGKAVAGALRGYAKKESLDTLATKESVEEKVSATVKGTTGTSLVSNEEGGAVLKFTSTDGNTLSGVAVNDGSNDIYAQLYAKTKDNSQAIRLNVGLDGIYYTKNQKNLGEKVEGSELATKSDVDPLSNEIDSMDARLESAENSINTITSKLEELEKLKEQFTELQNRLQTTEVTLKGEQETILILQGQVSNLSEGMAHAVQQVNACTENLKQITQN